jgi:hypothetical protein
MADKPDQIKGALAAAEASRFATLDAEIELQPVDGQRRVAIICIPRDMTSDGIYRISKAIVAMFEMVAHEQAQKASGGLVVPSKPTLVRPL